MSFIGLDKEILSNSIFNWLIFLTIASSIYVVLSWLKKRANTLVSNESIKNDFKNILLSIISTIKPIPIIIFSILIASFWLNLPSSTKSLISKILIVTLIFQIAIWSNIIIDYIVDIYAKKRLNREDSEASKLFGPIKFMLLLIVWSLLLLMALDNMGVNITAFVTGLGIGGIAVALAVQNILGDLFSSLSIVLDKPFEVGDLVVVEDITGKVERVGVKTTRIRSVSGEQVIISNSNLLKAKIKNFKKMEERRVLFRIGVVYESSLEQLKKIPEIIKNCINNTSHARFERAHFVSFGPYSLDFEIVYYVDTNDYATYMDVQQQINLSIMEEFEKFDIKFAYPTQQIYMGDNSAKERKDS